MKHLFSTTALIAALGMAGMASAGALEEPAPEPPVAAPVDWSGAYVGLIASFNSGDFGGEFGGADIFPGDGSGDLSGNSFGLVLGYDVQNGQYVYGGEFSYASADITGSEDCNNPAFQCAFEVEKVASLRGRIGYLVAPKTLVYGTLGVTRAEATGFVDSGGGPIGEDNTINGVVYGIGMEKMIGERSRLRAAILRHDFDGEDFQTDILYEDIESAFTSVEFGFTFSF
ncbi:outer membrane protein [Thalassobius sp. S69A]|uniref:outer membrane protein n=1 Tax=unclassified Thalassovita TaxID=2619711 RepID=UPI000C6607FD|nr:hypothetical protein [Paracoccaceae bacterium]